MNKYRIAKFECGTLIKLAESTVTTISVEEARKEAHDKLKCKGNQFVGAESISE